MATGKVIPLQELKDSSSVVASVCSPLTGDQDAQHQAAASPVSTPVTVPLGSAYPSTAASSSGHLPVKPAPEGCTRTREALMSDLLTTKVRETPSQRTEDDWGLIQLRWFQP